MYSVPNLEEISTLEASYLISDRTTLIEQVNYWDKPFLRLPALLYKQKQPQSEQLKKV